MIGDSLATILVAGVAAIGSIVCTLIASKAARNTKPISNGFAEDVRKRLERIETLIVNHLEDHAENDLRRGRR